MADSPDPTPDPAPAKAPPPAPAPTTRRRGISATLILGVLLPLVVMILAAQNTADVTFEFLFWDARTPLVVIILGSALAGVVIHQIATLLWRGRRPRQSRR